MGCLMTSLAALRDPPHKSTETVVRMEAGRLIQNARTWPMGLTSTQCDECRTMFWPEEAKGKAMQTSNFQKQLSRFAFAVFETMHSK